MKTISSGEHAVVAEMVRVEMLTFVDLFTCQIVELQGSYPLDLPCLTTQYCMDIHASKFGPRRLDCVKDRKI